MNVKEFVRLLGTPNIDVEVVFTKTTAGWLWSNEDAQSSKMRSSPEESLVDYIRHLELLRYDDDDDDVNERDVYDDENRIDM
jgi:hypothetical protein